ncbi:MAG: T9SS type A sorting domain-containing protein [Ignavibacteriota bacterium]
MINYQTILRIRPIHILLLGLLLSFPRTISAQWETLGKTPYAYGNGPALFTYFLAPVGLPEVGYCSFENLDTLYKTTDFGKTWSASFGSPYSVQSYVTDIVFKDSLHGWLCTWDDTYTGDTTKMHGKIYSTSDGGNSWQEASPLRGAYWKLNYNPLTHCLIVVGSETAGFVISRDDGATFTWKNDHYEYEGILFIRDSIIILFNPDARIQSIRSTDEGLTWTKLDLPSASGIQPYYDAETGLAFFLGSTSDQTLFVSSDKGLTWSARFVFTKPTNGQIVGSCGYIATAYSVNNLNDSSTVMLSSDYGLTWQDIGRHYEYNGSLFNLMKMDPTGLYLINNGVIQRYPLPNSLRVYLGSATSYVTPNGFETDIPIFSTVNSFDVVISLSPSNDINFTVAPSSGWNIVTKQLGTGFYELIGKGNGGDSLSGILQLYQSLTDSREETVTLEQGPLDAAMLASCAESKTTYSLPLGCGNQTLSDFMGSGKLPEFSLRPNPASNSLTIQSSINLSNVQCNLFDQLGRSVLRREGLDFAGDRKVTLDVSNIPSGMYYLRMEGEGISRGEKVVVGR